MKSIKSCCLAVVFALAIALPAFAGDIATPGVSPAPAPTPASVTAGDISTPVAGDIATGNSEAAVTGSVTEVALGLLQGVLSLF